MRTAAIGLTLGLAAAAHGQDLMALLDRGPVVSIEVNAKGRFDRATAVVQIRAPADAVWRVATDFEKYKTFMPKVEQSEPKAAPEGQTDVSYEIEVPGPNSFYTFRYALDPAKRQMHGRWVKGDIKGSYVDWRLVPHGEGTLLYYTTSSRNFSSLAESLEDEQQTVTVGVNVAAALAVVKAMKRHLEAPSASAEATDGGAAPTADADAGVAAALP